VHDSTAIEGNTTVWTRSRQRWTPRPRTLGRGGCGPALEQRLATWRDRQLLRTLLDGRMFYTPTVYGVGFSSASGRAGLSAV
jgi:hypothetical protein